MNTISNHVLSIIPKLFILVPPINTQKIKIIMRAIILITRRRISNLSHLSDIKLKCANFVQVQNLDQDFLNYQVPILTTTGDRVRKIKQ